MRLLWLGLFALSACTVVNTQLLPRTVVEPLRHSPEGVVVHTERVFYPVQAANEAEARARVVPAAAALGVGDRMQGFTRWRVNWKYDFAMRDGVCRVGKANVELLLRVVMPELFSDAVEKATLRDRWLLYSSLLAFHEQGHVDNGLACARELKRKLEELEQPSCENFKEAVTSLTGGIISRYNALDVQYDADTRHGMGQGVKLP